MLILHASILVLGLTINTNAFENTATPVSQIYQAKKKDTRKRSKRDVSLTEG